MNDATANLDTPTYAEQARMGQRSRWYLRVCSRVARSLRIPQWAQRQTRQARTTWTCTNFDAATTTACHCNPADDSHDSTVELYILAFSHGHADGYEQGYADAILCDTDPDGSAVTDALAVPAVTVPHSA